MSESTFRVVSVGDKRAAERMFRIVQTAAYDAGLTSEQMWVLASAVAQAAQDEGLVLTWQVKP